MSDQYIRSLERVVYQARKLIERLNECKVGDPLPHGLKKDLGGSLQLALDDVERCRPNPPQQDAADPPGEGGPPR